MRVEAAARNEELFRTVNEKIEAVSQTVPATDPNMEFLCECDDVDCVEKVRLTVAGGQSAPSSSRAPSTVP